MNSVFQAFLIATLLGPVSSGCAPAPSPVKRARLPEVDATPAPRPRVLPSPATPSELASFFAPAEPASEAELMPDPRLEGQWVLTQAGCLKHGKNEIIMPAQIAREKDWSRLTYRISFPSSSLLRVDYRGETPAGEARGEADFTLTTESREKALVQGPRLGEKILPTGKRSALRKSATQGRFGYQVVSVRGQPRFLNLDFSREPNKLKTMAESLLLGLEDFDFCTQIRLAFRSES